MSINELESEQKDWALSMLCRSGVLSPCRHHEGVYVDEGIDIESAYKYSMKVYKSNEDKSPFCNVRESTRGDLFYLNSLRRVLFYGDDKCTSEY
ncbi:hypothetical protein [Ancylomarina sp. 16SWW S1-10-2]|uniref:hypothetical protein n=1 Tax=Ancylomarina sp. 16SWW S1-10-2 TaxID=2499681 RepID=UPI0034CFCAD9